MLNGRHAAAVLLLSVLAGAQAAGTGAAHAQASGGWVDPPADLASPPPSGSPTPGGQTPPAIRPPAPPPAAPQPREAAPAPQAAPPVRSAQPERTAPPPSMAPDRLPADPPVQSAQPERPPAAPPVQSARPERAPADPRAPSQSAQPATPPAPLPPARAERPAPPEASPETRSATAERRRPRADDQTGAREEAARELVVEYLDAWSAPNPLTLASTSEFYAPNVIFHGRSMTSRELLEEKRRFVQRWPERRYRPREDTMGVACGSRADTCTVRSVFDFTATDPRRGRRSQGVATLELVVSFRDDERPVITAESSLVHGRRAGGGSLGAGDDDEP